MGDLQQGAHVQLGHFLCIVTAQLPISTSAAEPLSTPALPGWAMEGVCLQYLVP